MSSYLDLEGLGVYHENNKNYINSKVPTKTSDLTNDSEFVTESELNTKAPLSSPTLTGTPKAPTATAGTNTTQIATTAFVTTAVANGIAASDAMIIKGTIGTSGTVTSLPTTYKTGWTYRVVTAGTYAGQVCEIGDLIVALVDRSGSGNVDSDWCVAQTNINGAITGIKSGDAYIATSQSGSVVTITHKDVTRTNTTSTASPSHGGTFTAVKTVTSDAKGHVTGVDTETVTLPTYTALKNPNAISINGKSYDGSSAVNVGTIGAAYGGTGKTSLNDSANVLINSLSTGDATPSDADYYVVQYAGGGTTTTTYHRRPISTLWNYIKSKLATVATSGSYNDLSNKPTIGNGTVTIKQAGTSKGTFTMNQSGNTTIELTDNNTTYSNATTSSAGLMSASDKTKLDGITASADSVSVTQKLTSGTEIGTVTINGTGTKLYAPTNTDTHYTSKNVVGSSTATSNTTSALTNGNVYINSVENGVVTSSHKISGSGATKVTTDANGNIIITSTDNASGGEGVTYELSKSGSTITLTGSDGSTSSVTDNNTTYTHPTTSGNKHIPSGGSSGQILRWSADGTAVWGSDNNTTYSVATTSANGLMSSTDKTKLDATNIAYGTCSTDAATATKVITISGNTNWKLVAGSMITVKFSATNTAQNPTFNVNSTGAKSVWYNTAVITTSSLGYAGTANRPMNFVYDGTQYVFVGWSLDNNTTYSNASLGQGYGTCATAAATVAKVVTLSSYSLTTGGIVSIKFTNAVPASATMNINGKGAKAIYYRGSAIKAGIINAGDMATFIYNGSQYHLIAIDSEMSSGGGTTIYKQTSEPTVSDTAVWIPI